MYIENFETDFKGSYASEGLFITKHSEISEADFTGSHAPERVLIGIQNTKELYRLFGERETQSRLASKQSRD